MSHLYIDQLTDAEIASLEQRLRPGQSSEGGFLGPNEKLRDVLVEDQKILAALGLGYEDISAALDAVMEGRAGSHLSVRRMAYRGSQECPFDGMIAKYSNADYVVTNDQGATVTFPGLISHLIKEHQFFEGRGTSYRVDPEQLVNVLGIGYTRPDASETVNLLDRPSFKPGYR